MSTRLDVLYVSPHSDDVAFSAAAQLHQDVASGARVGIFTLFQCATGALAPFADVARRRREDQDYADLTGAVGLHADLPDASMRRGRYELAATVFAPMRRSESPLVAQAQALLQEFVAHGCRTVVAPLGIGEHVDHQITHVAARQLTGCVVRYYEDAPYVFCRGALARRMSRLGWAPIRPDPTLRRQGRLVEAWRAALWLARTPLLQDERLAVRLVAALLAAQQTAVFASGRSRGVIPICGSIVGGPESASVKQAAIEIYASQWPLFYATLAEWRTALAAQAQALGYPTAIERYWTLV